MNNIGTRRENVGENMLVKVVKKKDQSSGILTKGYVKRILTNSKYHSHGIKVELKSGEVGRVKDIIED